jgi:hypothetical protein
MRAFCRCNSSDQQKDQNIDFHCRRSIYSIRSLIQEIRMVLGMEVEVDFASTEHNATRSIYTWALLPETGPLGQEDDALCAAAAFLYRSISYPLHEHASRHEPRTIITTRRYHGVLRPPGIF